jgi:hypothetical protein
METDVPRRVKFRPSKSADRVIRPRGCGGFATPFWPPRIASHLLSAKSVFEKIQRVARLAHGAFRVDAAIFISACDTANLAFARLSLVEFSSL